MSVFLVYSGSTFELYANFRKATKKTAPAHTNRGGLLNGAFIGGYLIQSEVTGIFPFSFFFQFSGCNQLAEGALNGAVAERRTKLADVLLIEPPDSILACSAHHFQCGQLGFHKHHAILEVFVGGKDRPEQVLDEGHYILDSFVPAGLRLCKCIVVQILVLGDFGFQGDILADIKTVSVQKHRRETAL